LASDLLSTSDKSFWHGYLDFYDKLLPKVIDGAILEFGVFKGYSIRWLLESFPAARVFGADILPVQPEWPLDPRVTYAKVDQADENAVRELVSSIANLDLIIEDGSHFPRHQSICLKHGLAALRPGGVYVLEDIHTSHPAHQLYRQEFGSRRGQTAYSVLLGIDHMRRIHADAEDERFRSLGRGSHFSYDDVRALAEQIQSIAFYRRATLPTSCWNCGSTRFSYHDLKCECGWNLLDEADSMTIVIKKRSAPPASPQ
jgi:hypothetical protein